MLAISVHMSILNAWTFEHNADRFILMRAILQLL